MLAAQQRAQVEHLGPCSGHCDPGSRCSFSPIPAFSKARRFSCSSHSDGYLEREALPGCFQEGFLPADTYLAQFRGPSAHLRHILTHPGAAQGGIPRSVTHHPPLPAPDELGWESQEGRAQPSQPAGTWTWMLRVMGACPAPAPSYLSSGSNH